jgi:hypothetical protein
VQIILNRAARNGRIRTSSHVPGLGGDGGCCAIHRRERMLTAGAITFAGDARPITAVAKLSRLRFTAPLIDRERTPGAGTSSGASRAASPSQGRVC